MEPYKGLGAGAVGALFVPGGLPIAIGLAIPSAITGVISLFRSYDGVSESVLTAERIDQMEKELHDVTGQNDAALDETENVQTAYREGALENLQRLTA